MNPTRIESVANAVLYEGYMLYPYRPSSVKNRQRWNFGVVYPRAYAEMQTGSDIWLMQTQCLVRGDESAAVDIKVRFLQAVTRQIGKPLESDDCARAENAGAEFEIVESLAIGDKILRCWQEAVERELVLPAIRLGDLLIAPVQQRFEFPAGREVESQKDGEGKALAYIVRTRHSIDGYVDISAAKCGDGIYRVTVSISNLTSVDLPDDLSRESVLLRSLLSAHTILGVHGGEFVSLIDPPPELQEFASECKNIGTYPVLAGEENSKDAILSSPIILYDYPQIAPESPGDLFDGTEIDEILALRIMTLSDDEKREIRNSDDRAREILDRTETLPAEHFMKLHGVLRGMKPASDSDNLPNSFSNSFTNEGER